MPVYPHEPLPSSISSPAIIDPMHVFVTDQGYEMRRSQHMRQRRRYQVDYTGKTDAELHVVRDFLSQRRLGMEPFEWAMPVYYSCTTAATTPVIVFMPHSFVTGQWVGISATPYTGLNGLYEITRINASAFSLNGTTAGPASTGTLFIYLPNAVARFADNTMDSAAKLKGYWYHLGPQAIWAFQVLIEEIF